MTRPLGWDLRPGGSPAVRAALARAAAPT